MSVEQVCEASWQAILTDEEEPDVQAEHAKLQPVDEPLLVIEASRQHLPVDGHLVRAAELAFDVTTEELGVFEISLPVSAA